MVGRLRRAALVGGVVVGSLLAAGCGEGGTSAGPDGSGTPSGSLSSPSAGASARPSWPTGLTSTAAVTGSLDPRSGPAVLVGVGVYPGEGADHVGLSFRGRRAAPCVARFVDGPVTDSAGRRLTVAGDAFLQIRCRQVSDVALGTNSGLRPGVDRFRPEGTPNVIEVARVGYRGALLTLVVGLRHVAPIAGGMYIGGGDTVLEFVVGQ